MDMSDRFRRGAALLVFGTAAAAADVQHVAVEFTHPVLVGKRAIPALALTGASDSERDGGGSGDGVARRIGLLARPGDVALAITPGEPSPGLRRGLRAARDLGLLTVAMVGGGARAPKDADHVLLAAPNAGAGDPRATRELQVTTYHLLWEIAHLHLEHAHVLTTTGASAPATPAATCGADAADAADAADTCVTCADEAAAARVLRVTDDGMAEVDTGHGTAWVSVALVDARAGATVLVHAGEAIGIADGTEGGTADGTEGGAEHGTAGGADTDTGETAETAAADRIGATHG